MSAPWDPTARPQPRPPPPLALARPVGTADVRPEPIESPVGKTFGGYRILSVIQRGGMGEIFLAEPTQGARRGEQVVLKRLLKDFDEDERYCSMIESEAQVTLRMDHPNIVKVFDAPLIDGKQCLAMEFVHGRNVSQILKRCRSRQQNMPPQVALTILLHVLEGLQYAHSMVMEDGRPMDLVHRDVTPGNILVSFDGAVKMTDFGIAKSRMSVVSTTVGVVKGTTRYLSPEQIRSQDVDGRSDIFSAATVLTEMLTLKPLFDRGAVPPTLFAIIKGEREPIADMLPFLAPKLASAIEKALSVSPRSRFASAAAFADALREAQRELGRPLPVGGVGRFIQDLFGDQPKPAPKPRVAVPPPTPATGPSPDRSSLDLTYLFEVGDPVTRDVIHDSPPLPNPELDAELERILTGVEPLSPNEFQPTPRPKRAPPPVPPMTGQFALPSFPETTSSRQSLAALHVEMTRTIDVPPPRFPPPSRNGEQRAEEAGATPKSDADANRDAILEALDEVVALVESATGESRQPRTASAIIEPPSRMSDTTRRVLFLAGILCGALLVWGTTSFASKVVSEPKPVVMRTLPRPAPALAEANAKRAESEVSEPAVDLRGKIDVRQPRGARVYIDGIRLSRRVPIRRFEVEPGERVIVIKKGEYERRVQIAVQGGQHLDITNDEFRELAPPADQ